MIKLVPKISGDGVEVISKQVTSKDNLERRGAIPQDMN